MQEIRTSTFSRYADDAKLEHMQKARVLADDPMQSEAFSRV